MRKWILFVCLLVLFSGERAWAQRAGPGLFMGPGVCSDVTGQVANQTFCMDYASGALYVWDGSKYIPISGNGTSTFSGPTIMSLTNTNNGTSTQAYSQWSNGTGIAYAGIKGTGYAIPPAIAGAAFVGGGGGSTGLFISEDQAGSAIYFSADAQGATGELQLTEDSSANFYWTLPNNVLTFVRNGNVSLDIVASNTGAGTGSQGGFFVQNASGIIGGFSAIGASATAFPAPYQANQPYVNGDTTTGLLLYGAGGALHLAASGAPYTLDMTADGSGNFNFASNNTTLGQGYITFQSNATVRALSENNNAVDDFQVMAQNLTQGIGISWSYIRQVGTCGNCGFDLSGKTGGTISIQGSNVGSNIVAQGPLYAQSGNFTVQNNYHVLSTNNGQAPPGISSCANGFLDVNSTDTAGLVSFNNGGTQYCLINFGRIYNNPPYCVCTVVDSFSPSTIIGRCFATVNTAQVQLNFDSGVQNSTAKAVWHCIGNG